ncbi:MAG: hypothetical protein Q4D12_01780 [Bacteroidales bacterium]|nr:hypothetical protein [Bacteroidales bacterium]
MKKLIILSGVFLLCSCTPDQRKVSVTVDLSRMYFNIEVVND